MMPQMVSRTQRRLERKQLGLIAVLIVAVAGVSFVLGVLYGQKRAVPAVAAVTVERPRQQMATQVVVPPPPPVATTAAPEPEKLTFYDNLPKGNQAPLGSGINLPPETKKAEVQPAEQASAKPVEKPAVSAVVQSTTAPPPPSAAVAVPAVKPEGNFFVQVASFKAKDDAAKLIDRLQNYQLKPSLEQANLGQKGVWYRVLVGPFATRESADQVVALLKEKERLAAMVRPR